MFTILKYVLTTQNGTVLPYASVYLNAEAKLVFSKLLRDSRVSQLGFVGQYETLEAARVIQSQMRQSEAL